MQETMIAFEISRNGQVLAVAGAKDLVGLYTTLMAYGDLSDSDGVTRFFVSAIGHGTDPIKNTFVNHTWDMTPIAGEFLVGDTLSIRIIRTDSPNLPTTSLAIEDNDSEDEDEESGPQD